MTVHAVERLRERYGLEVEPQHLVPLVNRLKKGKGLLVSKMDDGSTVHVIEFRGVLVKCVLSADQSRIMTFLPMGSGVSRKRIRNPGYTSERVGRAYFKRGKKVYGAR